MFFKGINKITNHNISKTRKSSFVKAIEIEIEEKFEKIWVQFVGGVAFKNYPPHRPMLLKRKKNL